MILSVSIDIFERPALHLTGSLIKNQDSPLWIKFSTSREIYWKRYQLTVAMMVEPVLNAVQKETLFRHAGWYIPPSHFRGWSENPNVSLNDISIKTLEGSSEFRMWLDVNCPILRVIAFWYWMKWLFRWRCCELEERKVYIEKLGTPKIHRRGLEPLDYWLSWRYE